jgi:SAM-dependent methyltransferase
MFDIHIITIFFENLDSEDIKGKKILEVHSKHNNWSLRPDVNWSFRSIIENHLNPGDYIGIDISSGKYVDLVLSVHSILNEFGPEYFDIILVNDVLHYIRDWKNAIKNIMDVLKKGGLIYLTTKSRGSIVPKYPHAHRKLIDYWRFGMEEIKNIFSDFEIVLLKNKPISLDPGVIYLGKKLNNYNKEKLEKISVYSLILKRNTTKIPKEMNQQNQKFFIKIIKKARLFLEKLESYVN